MFQLMYMGLARHFRNMYLILINRFIIHIKYFEEETGSYWPVCPQAGVLVLSLSSVFWRWVGWWAIGGREINSFCGAFCQERLTSFREGKHVVLSCALSRGNLNCILEFKVSPYISCNNSLTLLVTLTEQCSLDINFSVRILFMLIGSSFDGEQT